MRTGFWSMALILAVAATAAAQDPPARGRQGQGQGGFLGRPSPPQPQQRQGPDYFAGSWKFSWVGRESAITPGPRTGTVTFTRMSDANSLEMRVEGSSEAAGAYKESGVVTWNDEKKTLTMREHLASGVDVASVGDWSSPIGIHFECEPITREGPDAETAAQLSDPVAHFLFGHRGVVDQRWPVRPPGHGRFQEIKTQARTTTMGLVTAQPYTWLSPPAPVSAPTRSSRRSARAGWAKSTRPATRGSIARSPSKCCRPTWRPIRSGARGSSARPARLPRSSIRISARSTTSARPPRACRSW